MGIQGRQQANQMAQQEAPVRQQILGQQAQQGQMELQQAQQAQQDQQTFRSAMQDPSNHGKTIGDIADTLADSGHLSPTAWAALKKTDVEQKTALASLTGDQLKNAKEAHSQTQELYNNAMDMPDDQLAANWPQIAQQYDAIPGNQKMPLNPQQPLTKQQLQQFGPMLSMHGAYMDWATERQDKQTKLKTDQLNNQKTAGTMEPSSPFYAPSQAAISMGIAPGSAAIQAGEAQQAGRKAAAEETAKLPGEMALRAPGLSIESARLKFDQTKAGMGADGTSTNLAQAIASGHIAPDRMAFLLSKNPELIQGVMNVDPSFDSSKAAAYPSVYKDFTSGKSSVAINAGGTALGHLQELKSMNTVESHIPGTPDYNAYQNKADTVASELAKFYGDATIPAIAAIKKTLTATLPGNRDAAIQTQAQSMGDKLDAFQQQWQNAAPSKSYEAPMPGISQKAIAARKSLAGEAQSSGIVVRAPNGKDYTFQDQASADAFKAKAGIK